MFHIAAVLSVLAAVASASKPQGKIARQINGQCAQFFIDKSALQVPVCPVQSGDLHFICGDYASTDAAQVCASLGWRLAVLVEGVNTADASTLITQCAGTFEDQAAWIAGYNGMAADPCMMAFQVNGGSWSGAYANLGIQYCQTVQHNILCQDIPIVTESITVGTNTVSTGSGAATSVTLTTTETTRTLTVCPTTTSHPTWCPCSSSSSTSSCDCHCGCSWDCKAGDKSCKQCPAAAKGFVQKAAAPLDKRHPRHHRHSSSSSSCSGTSSSCPPCPPQPPSCDNCDRNPLCNTCNKVCNYTASNIRLLTRLVEPEDAAAECAKFGWFLLDMLAGQEADVKYVLDNCQDSSNSAGAWMNSFDGITANCTFAEINDGRVNAQFPIGGDFCDGGYQVLCQTSCPDPVGIGADGGIISVNIEFVTPTTTIYTPTTTVVVTSVITSTTTSIVINSA